MLNIRKISFPTISKLMNLYPPFLGAGVKIKVIDPKEYSLEVSMPLRFYNKNYVGTQFGGSLYSMVDPFYMLILMNKIGSDYIVWDKEASIRFKKPGRGRVRAKFEISHEVVENIKNEVSEHGKCEPIFTVDVLSESDEVVATVEKKLWVMKKKK